MTIKRILELAELQALTEWARASEKLKKNPDDEKTIAEEIRKQHEFLEIQRMRIDGI